MLDKPNCEDCVKNGSHIIACGVKVEDVINKEVSTKPSDDVETNTVHICNDCDHFSLNNVSAFDLFRDIS